MVLGTGLNRLVTGDRVVKQRSSGGRIARERAAAGRELKSFITVMSKRKVL